MKRILLLLFILLNHASVFGQGHDSSGTYKNRLTYYYAYNKMVQFWGPMVIPDTTESVYWPGVNYQIGGAGGYIFYYYNGQWITPAQAGSGITQLILGYGLAGVPSNTITTTGTAIADTTIIAAKSWVDTALLLYQTKANLVQSLGSPSISTYISTSGLNTVLADYLVTSDSNALGGYLSYYAWTQSIAYHITATDTTHYNNAWLGYLTSGSYLSGTLTLNKNGGGNFTVTGFYQSWTAGYGLTGGTVTTGTTVNVDSSKLPTWNDTLSGNRWIATPNWLSTNPYGYLTVETDPLSFHKVDSNTHGNAVTLDYYNNHLPGVGVSTVTATAPIISSGGTTPNITFQTISPFSVVANTTSANATPAQSYSVSASGLPSTLAYRGPNGNLLNNINFVNTTSTFASGGTTILTASSSAAQVITGSASQTFQLPDATTFKLGPALYFNNNSSGSLIITNNGGSTLYTVPAGGEVTVGASDISTSNGVWDVHARPPSTVTWGSGTTGLVFNTALSTTPSIDAGASSSTNPTFRPQRGSPTNGYSGDGSALYLILGGVSEFSVNSAGHVTIEGVTTNGTTGTDRLVFSASPIFTGSPIAPTRTIDDSSTKIANTAYVDRYKPSYYTTTTTTTLTPIPANTGRRVPYYYYLSAQASTLTIANPTGTWADMQVIVIKVKDNGGAQTLSFGTNYDFGTASAPTTTTAGKRIYLEFMADSLSGKFDYVTGGNNGF